MILVLTPLDFEHQALKKHSDSTQTTDLEPIEIHVGGHGKVQFALTTHLLIQKFSPRLVICAGTAGSLTAELNAGDVVIGQTTVEHDFLLKFVSKPLPEFHADAATLAILQDRCSFDNFKVKFGRIASGDEDVIDQYRAAAIHLSTRAAAVAWEGAGGARAARLNKTPFIEMRVITDSCNQNSLEDFTKTAKIVLSHLAEVIQVLR